MNKWGYFSVAMVMAAASGMMALSAPAYADTDAQAQISALKAEIQAMEARDEARQKAEEEERKASAEEITKLAQKIDALQTQTSKQVSKVDSLQKMETQQTSTVADLKKKQASEAQQLSTVEPAAGGGHHAAANAAEMHDWTGFYTGASLGGGVSNASIASNNTLIGAPPAANVGGGIFQGGIRAGYNHQAGATVLGAEAELNLGTQNGSTQMGTFAPTTTYKSEIGWSAALLGRVGLASGDTLFFADAGPAMARLNGATDCPACGVDGTSFTDWVPGIKGGVGAEMMVAPSVSLRAQYSVLDLANKKASPPASSVANAGWQNLQQTATVGADWHF